MLYYRHSRSLQYVKYKIFSVYNILKPSVLKPNYEYTYQQSNKAIGIASYDELSNTIFAGNS